MRKQCVPGASPFFARAGDEATATQALPGSVYNVYIEIIFGVCTPNL